MALRRATTVYRIACLAAAALALAWAPSPSAAQPSEAAVKAAFLTKFPSYLAWPPPARPAGGAPYTICILGNDPFGGMADGAVRGQQIDGHPLQLRRMTSAAGAERCHIAFVQGSGAQATAAMLTALSGRPVLTVTDARGGGAQGMIHFVLHQGRVRFHVDEAAANRSGLLINSRLLGVALSVKRGRS
jgi:hypothetical protein